MGYYYQEITSNGWEFWGRWTCIAKRAVLPPETITKREPKRIMAEPENYAI